WLLLLSMGLHRKSWLLLLPLIQNMPNHRFMPQAHMETTQLHLLIPHRLYILGMGNPTLLPIHINININIK
ncbi:hypothetical protein XENORESO_020801, partial [Xenotaenia resolanae]